MRLCKHKLVKQHYREEETRNGEVHSGWALRIQKNKEAV
jgi:hypothetical protein